MGRGGGSIRREQALPAAAPLLHGNGEDAALGCEEGLETTGFALISRALDSYFQVSQRGSTLATEFRAGTTSFLASSNNFVVNAQIMAYAGIGRTDCVVSSAFVTALACIATGLLSNLPLGTVTSVGPNVFLAYSLVGQHLCSVEGALAVSAASGLVLSVLAATPLLMVLLGLVPLSVKYGLVIGTGLFTAFIGLKSIGVVVADTSAQGHGNIVALGDLHSTEALICGVFLILTASLLHRAVKGSVLIGMLAATFVSWACTGEWPESYFAARQLPSYSPDFSVLTDPHMWVQVMALTLMLLFSISGAVIGCARMAGLLDKGDVPGSSVVYFVCGVSTMLSAALGSSPLFVSMSAAAGIRDGGRTGLVSIVLGLYCLVTAFWFSPLAAAIPHCATAPVLVLVGVSMAGEAKEVRWWNMQEALPAFLCAIFQPFTYSVANGIYAGVAASCILFFTTGEFMTYLPKRLRVVANSTAPLPSYKHEETLDDDVIILESLKTARRDLADKQQAMSKGGMFSTSPTNGGTGSFRTSATRALECMATCLGLDGTAVRRTVLFRLGLGGARSAERHCLGGIPGSEVKLALNEIDEASGCSDMPATDGGWVDLGPEMASIARRRRFARQSRSQRTPRRASGFHSVQSLPEMLTPSEPRPAGFVACASAVDLHVNSCRK